MSRPQICFLGNSHIVCLKEAIEAREALPFDTKFIYAPGSRLDSLRIVERNLITLDEEALRYLRRELPYSLDAADAFVIVGLSLSISPCASVYRDYRFSPPEGEDSEAGLQSRRSRSKEGPFLISEGAFRAAVGGLIEDTDAVRLAKLLRAATDKPIYLIPQPNPLLRIREHVPTDTQSRAWRAFLKWKPLMDAGIGEQMNRFFTEEATRRLDKLQLSFLPQEDATRMGAFSHDRFAREKSDDHRHMNADYGDTLLNQIEGLDFFKQAIAAE
jgi:hypothetical protein